MRYLGAVLGVVMMVLAAGGAAGATTVIHEGVAAIGFLNGSLLLALAWISHEHDQARKRSEQNMEQLAAVLQMIQRDLMTLHSTVRVATHGSQGATVPTAGDSGARALLSKATNHLEAIEANTAHANALIQWAAERSQETVSR